MLSQTVFCDCKDCLVLRVVYCVCVKFECYVYVAVGYYVPSLVGTKGAGVLLCCGLVGGARAWRRTGIYGSFLQAVWLPVVAWVRVCWRGSGGGVVGRDVLGRSTWACYYTTWCC